MCCTWRSAVSCLKFEKANGMSHNLHSVPICFSSLASAATKTVPLYNGDIASMACEVSSFAWDVYGLNNNHFLSTMNVRNLPFRIVLAPDTRQADVPSSSNMQTSLTWPKDMEEEEEKLGREGL